MTTWVRDHRLVWDRKERVAYCAACRHYWPCITFRALSAGRVKPDDVDTWSVREETR